LGGGFRLHLSVGVFGHGVGRDTEGLLALKIAGLPRFFHHPSYKKMKVTKPIDAARPALPTVLIVAATMVAVIDRIVAAYL
jgi:hypothetical protein